MKLSGFTLVRQGEKFDYPYLESIRSLLPWVDELVVNVGRGDDSTESQLQALIAQESKLKIIVTDWPMSNPQKGGELLSEQTNIALDRCTGDWCIYLQADEVLHEEDAQKIRDAIFSADRSGADAVVFNYVHFYGSYQVVQKTRSAYRREVRAVRRSSGARSVGDAQSFRLASGEKLRAVLSSARIFHYGWVRSPEKMKEKTFFMDQLYHGAGAGDHESGTPFTGDNYLYKKIWGLRKFEGTHPSVMRERIQKKDWNWDLDRSPWTWRLSDGKKIVLDLLERLTGYRAFEYKSYRLIK